MLVSLPMYDWPEVQEYTDRFWHRMHKMLSQSLADVPPKLNRDNIGEQWQSDELLLSQTCIYPLKTSLPKSVIVVGTPNYRCDYSSNGMYASPILVRSSDERSLLADYAGSTLAFNNEKSQSGFNALKNFMVEEKLIGTANPCFFGNAIRTQSHRASVQAVANGAADICALDPVSWALAKQHEPLANKLKVIGQTQYSPALPLISNITALPATIDEPEWRLTIKTAFENAIDSEAQQHLLLDSLSDVPLNQYLALHIDKLAMIKTQ